MIELKENKQAIVSYGLHSPFVREMVKMGVSSNKTIPHNWHQLVKQSSKMDHRCYGHATSEKRQKF